MIDWHEADDPEEFETMEDNLLWYANSDPMWMRCVSDLLVLLAHSVGRLSFY